MGAKIRRGCVDELNEDSGDWIFVDIGFATKKKSCGVLKNCEKAQLKTFGKTVEFLKQEVGPNCLPLNLVIEAPLSVAFRKNGNPVGRSVEREDSNEKNPKHRYWNEQAGAHTLHAAHRLLAELRDSKPKREVRLFEGFVSFKDRGNKPSHKCDVERLRRAAWNPDHHCVIPRDGLKTPEVHTLECAFAFAGMDFGIPPVVFACEHDAGDPNCLP